MEYDRTVLDIKALNKEYMNNAFFVVCEDNPKYYKTVFMRWNIFTKSIQPCISNAVYGIPPDGMKEINPRLLAQLQRMHNFNAMNNQSVM